MFPYLVIDLNQLRSKEAITHAVSRCRDNGLQILVSDGMGFELSKSSEVLGTWRRSIELISGHADLIVASRKMTDMMREEVSEGQPVGCLVDDVATEVFRSFLARFANGDESSLRELVDGPIKDKMPASLDVWSDHQKHREDIISLRDSLSASLSEDELKQFRSYPKTAIKSFLLSDNGIRFVYQDINSRYGTDERSALRLAASPSVASSYISSMAALAIRWLAYQGLESAKPEQITNDLHDIEYAVLGSLCCELLTKDKRLREIHGAVKSAHVGRYNWFKDQLGAS